MRKNCEICANLTTQQNAARDTAKKNVETQRANTRIKRNQTIKTAERTEHTIKQSARSAGKQTVSRMQRHGEVN